MRFHGRAVGARGQSSQGRRFCRQGKRRAASGSYAALASGVVVGLIERRAPKGTSRRSWCSRRCCPVLHRSVGRPCSGARGVGQRDHWLPNSELLLGEPNATGRVPWRPSIARPMPFLLGSLEARTPLQQAARHPHIAVAEPVGEPSPTARARGPFSASLRACRGVLAVS